MIFTCYFSLFVFIQIQTLNNDYPMELKSLIEEAWEDRELVKNKEVAVAIKTVIEDLDNGKRRVAEPDGENWKVNEWLKKAVILYFPLMRMQLIEVGPFQFHDKIKLKSGYDQLGVRVVPHAIARYGAYVSAGTVLMPSYVNIGYGRKLCTNREKCPFERGRRNWGSFRTCSGCSCYHRRQCVHRVPVHYSRRG